MALPNGDFRFPPIPAIVCGRGAIQRVKQSVDESGAKRALVVTGRSIATRTDLVNRVKRSLGDRYAGVFSGVIAHVPRQCVIEGALMAREVGADLLISLGGSSTTDTAKGINVVLTESERIDGFFDKFDTADAIHTAKFLKPKLWQIAIPTTLSGAEFRWDIGITDTVRKCKDVFRNAKVTPKVVILDPEVTTFTPKELWGSTGLKNLSDGFMNICRREPVPFVSALALRGIQIINRYLVASLNEPLDLEARGMLQHAAWMDAYNAGESGLGIVGALRHQIGGGYNVPHGVASTIIFPHCLEFNRPEIDKHLVPIAEALGLPFRNTRGAASATVNRVRAIIKEIGVTTRLRDVGVPREGLEHIAEAALAERSIQTSFKPINSKEQLLGILEEAW